MRCFFTLALGAALAMGMSEMTWAQAAAGGGGGAGAAAAGGSGAGAGAASAGTGVTGAVPGGSATGNVPGGSPTGAVPGGSTQGQITGGNTASGVQTGTVPQATSGTNVRAGVNGRVNPNANARGNSVVTNQGYNGISRTPFFSDPNARRQLNLNSSQYNNLNQAYQNAYTRYAQGLRDITPNTTQQQRDLQMQHLQAQFNQDISGAVNNTFSDSNTLSRYNQLNRQFMGFNAFNDPAIRQQLNLTPAQQRQLRTLSNNWRQQLQQFRQGAGNDLSSVDTARWNQLWQQYTTQLNGVLTPDQQTIWAQQVGRPFVFSPSTYYGAQMEGPTGTNVGTQTRSNTDLNQSTNLVPLNQGTSTSTPSQPPTFPRQATQQGTTTPSTSNGTAR